MYSDTAVTVWGSRVVMYSDTAVAVGRRIVSAVTLLWLYGAEL
jgi:hypothetical protein